MEEEKHRDQAEAEHLEFPLKTNLSAFCKKFESNGWVFQHTSSKMIDSKSMDALGQYLQISHLPEMIFGNDRLFVSNAQERIILRFDPFEALKLTMYDERERRFFGRGIGSEERGQKWLINSIDLIPDRIEAEGAERFKQRDTSKIKDFQEVEP